MKSSPIFSRTYDLLRWLLPVTLKFPRQHRFVLASSIQNCVLAFQERLIEASLGSDATQSLLQADITLVKLRLYLRLSHDLNLLGDRQHTHAAKMVDEIGRLLGGWRKSIRG